MLLRRPWLLVLPLLFSLFLISAFAIWRNPAPAYKGQDLRVDIPVGDRFEIILLGDMGNGSPEQAAVADAMETYCQQHQLTAIIFLGDNFYMNGVTGTDDQQWKDKFLSVYGKDCLGKIPFYALLGNHDYKGNPAAQIAFHSENPSWHMPFRFYEITFGKRLQLVMSDSNIPDYCGSTTNCALDFMLDALQRGDFRDRLVLGHHPIRSASQKYHRQDIRGRLLQSLLCNRATSYIAGHAHHMEHRQFPGCSLDEFVSGAGGADLTPVNSEDPDSYFGLSKHGFLTLEASPEELRYSFRDTALDLLYSYTRKSGR
jgi:tartrate-resistant acid phosphatase type 5